MSVSRHASSTVRIIDFQPKSGPVGTPVTIYGTGFSATPTSNTVTFNGVSATVTSSTPTAIVATVPAAATTGAIGVTAPAGSDTSATPFTVTATNGAPTIGGFTPNIGTAGAVVNVTGTNFEPVPTQNRLSLYGMPRANAVVQSATASALDIVVPAKGRSGPLVVSTPAGTATSSADFFVPPSPYTPAHVAATGRLVVGGPTVPVSIPSGGKIALVVFEAAAGVTLNLGTVVTSGYPFPVVTIYRPDGAVLSTTGSNSARYLPPLPMAGIYTLVVSVGTFASTISLTLSEEVTGSAEVGGPSVTFSVPRAGQRATITFPGLAGQRVSGGITTTIPSSHTLHLKGPDGATLATTQISSAGAVDSPPLPSGGTYSVVFEPSGGGTGTFTLTLSEELAAGSVTVDGDPLSFSITRPGQRARITVAGTAGQRLSLGVTAGTLSGSVILYAPGGTSLMSSGYSIPGGVDFSQLTATGTHELVIDPNGAGTGSLTLILSQEITGTISLDGPAVPVTIARIGQRARLTLSGTANQRVSHTFGGTTINGNVSILRPDGAALQTASLPAWNFLEPTTLPSTGTYAILIDPNGGNTGSTTVTSYDVPPDVTGTLTINDPGLLVTISDPGQNANLTFSGTSGQAITIGGSGSTLGCITVTLIPPSGSSSAWGSCNASFGFTKTLGATGTHTVKIDPSGTSTGGVTVGATSP